MIIRMVIITILKYSPLLAGVPSALLSVTESFGTVSELTALTGPALYWSVSFGICICIFSYVSVYYLCICIVNYVYVYLHLYIELCMFISLYLYMYLNNNSDYVSFNGALRGVRPEPMLNACFWGVNLLRTSGSPWISRPPNSYDVSFPVRIGHGSGLPKLGRPMLYITTTQRGWCIEAFVSILVQSQSQNPGGGGVYNICSQTHSCL